MSTESVNNNTHYNKRIFLVALLLIAFVVFIILAYFSGLFSTNDTRADKTHFVIDNYFEFDINRDLIIYDEEAECDCMAIYMSARNISDNPDDVEVQVDNTTGYDEDTPTTDQLSDEEIEQLSNEEIAKINEKTINEYQKDLVKKKSLGSYLNVYAMQNNKELQEPTSLTRSGELNETNLISISKGAHSGEVYDIILMYQLSDQSDVSLIFSMGAPALDGMENGFNKTETVTIPVDGRMSPQLAQKLEEKKSEKKQEFPEQTASLKGVTLKTSGDWYIAEQGNAIIKIRNYSFDDKNIVINYLSSSSVESVLYMGDSGASYVIKKMMLAGKEVSYFERPDNSFVIAYVGLAGKAIRISSVNTSLEEARPILDSIQFE